MAHGTYALVEKYLSSFFFLLSSRGGFGGASGHAALLLQVFVFFATHLHCTIPSLMAQPQLRISWSNPNFANLYFTCSIVMIDSTNHRRWIYPTSRLGRQDASYGSSPASCILGRVPCFKSRLEHLYSSRISLEDRFRLLSYPSLTNDPTVSQSGLQSRSSRGQSLRLLAISHSATWTDCNSDVPHSRSSWLIT